MTRCASCRWWVLVPSTDSDSHYTEPLDLDTMQPLPQDFEVRRCANPRLTFCERPARPDGATLIDGSEYLAAFLTGPEFGCVLWEQEGS